jgi:hypothetical protein
MQSVGLYFNAWGAGSSQGRTVAQSNRDAVEPRFAGRTRHWGAVAVGNSQTRPWNSLPREVMDGTRKDDAASPEELKPDPTDTRTVTAIVWRNKGMSLSLASGAT